MSDDRPDVVPYILTDLDDVDGVPSEGAGLTYTNGVWTPGPVGYAFSIGAWNYQEVTGPDISLITLQVNEISQVGPEYITLTDDVTGKMRWDGPTVMAYQMGVSISGISSVPDAVNYSHNCNFGFVRADGSQFKQFRGSPLMSAEQVDRSTYEPVDSQVLQMDATTPVLTPGVDFHLYVSVQGSATRTLTIGNVFLSVVPVFADESHYAEFYP